VGKAWSVNIRYSRRALGQIDKALTYIEARSPQGAADVRDRVAALMKLLQEQPFAGHATTHPNVRRLFVHPYPYLIDYRVTATDIVIMRFRHTARRTL
jgi:toxin ParE1/3/4